MSEFVDWPAESESTVGLAVLLPGRNYPTTMPLLTFAGLAAAQRGWQVRAVSWTAPDVDTRATIDWVSDQLREAIGGFEGRVLVVEKSLGTCGARFASRRGYDAIWLTPLLHLPEIVDAMSHNAGRQLLIGGTQDPAWDLNTARTISEDVIPIEGADHAMFSGDAIRTAEVHVDVTRAIVKWLESLSSGVR